MARHRSTFTECLKARTWFEFAEVDIERSLKCCHSSAPNRSQPNLKHNMKKNDREQECGKEDRKRMAIAQGKKGGKIVLNTEQCSELNQVSGRERA